MKRHPPARPGAGIASLVVDPANADYRCYWYAGKADDHLIEKARAANASDAVAWGRRRTPRVRIRTPNGRTSWAGTAPRPQGFDYTWDDKDTTGGPAALPT